MLSGSKSGYTEMYPKNKVYFNANIFIDTLGKVWFGDFDVNKDADKMIEVVKEIGLSLYVVKELDGRFENENTQNYEALAVWKELN